MSTHLHGATTQKTTILTCLFAYFISKTTILYYISYFSGFNRNPPEYVAGVLTAGNHNRPTAGSPNRPTAGGPNRPTAGSPNRPTAMFCVFQTIIKINRALTMKAVRTSETSVNFYQTTRCNTPEDSQFRTHQADTGILAL
jgi:hypothetical protein